MMYRYILAACLAVFLLITAANAQKAEVTVSLNEVFFDALLDSIYRNYEPPEFSIAGNNVHRRDAETQSFQGGGPSSIFLGFDYFSASQRHGGENPVCRESIKILRENNGVRTAVRFRDGKIYVPLAFSGGYAPPFIGCVDFSGWAEANLDLEFDQAGQRLVGRARVLNVNLNGTGGVGGTVIAKLLQSSIDKKLNPIEILRVDKISFNIPIQNSGNIRMRATGIRPEIIAGMLDIHIEYEFLKG